MKHTSLAIVTVAALLLPALVCLGGGDNTVTFDNQSGQPALVKLVGPSPGEIQVPSGAKRSLPAQPGRYHIKVRYGNTGAFRYAKGEDFAIVQTPTSRSAVSITLHKVEGGNYNSHPISGEEFGSQKAAQQASSAVPPKATSAAIPMLLSKKPVPFEEIADQLPVKLQIKDVSRQEDETVVTVKVMPEAADKDNLDVVGVYLIEQYKQVTPLEALALCNRMSVFAGVGGGCFYSAILKGENKHIPDYRVFQFGRKPKDEDYLGQIMIFSGSTRRRGEDGLVTVSLPHSHPCLFFRKKGTLHVWMKKDKVPISNIVTAEVSFQEEK